MKQKVIRAELAGQAYLDFNEDTARLVFDGKMTDRQQEEATVLLGLQLLHRLIRQKVESGQSFVYARVEDLLPAPSSPETPADTATGS